MAPIHTKARSEFLAAVLALEDWNVDMVLGADYLLSGEVLLTIDSGQVKLHCLTSSIFFAPSSPVERLQSQKSSDEGILRNQQERDLSTSRQSLAKYASASLNNFMATDDTFMKNTPILTEFAQCALAEASDTPQAHDTRIGLSGIILLCGSDSDDGQVNMTSSLPAKCHADHHKAVFLNREYNADQPDGDQLARNSEMTPLYNPGVCGMVYSHGGVHLYGRHSTEPSDSNLLLRDRGTCVCGDGSAGLPATNEEGQTAVIKKLLSPFLAKWVELLAAG
ncbi:hypothetical protein HPB51_018544 [Rhipicephalus microplus]|uniref:Uncharacterized protein n=1 Tax=Rhipicephalus microplus TaxID=6941 RepID=A0A9J6DIX5_RHIMP|nr:hypothetical protein HPB51_018544 [Rhipicephalus microplus]